MKERENLFQWTQTAGTPELNTLLSRMNGAFCVRCASTIFYFWTEQEKKDGDITCSRRAKKLCTYFQKFLA